MGSDTNVPKVRQKLYGKVDLMASIGGLLGLTLGFSILSAFEILYLLTLRICCKRFRKWHLPPPATK
ncbi:unnamed protein product [Orchesella dallaii]|uniref:Uncharacterized protein n=1 Tax=Orchesella dallaii TaxID=48710 RepID=A0ABP1QUM1_9HEXA